MTAEYILSQILGIAVTALCLLTPQLKKKWQMCVVSAVANFTSGVSYLLVGSYTALGCCAVAVFHTVLRFFEVRAERKIPQYENVLFTILYILGGLLPFIVTGTLCDFAPLDTIPLVASVAFMAGIAVRDEQAARFFSLINAALYLIFNLIILNTQAIAMAATVISCLTAIIRYNKQQKREDIDK